MNKYSFFKTIFSIQFGITLLVVIAIASFIGLFIDSIFSTDIAYTYVYYSYWFAFLLVLLLINIIGCSYKSVINKFKLLIRREFKTNPEAFKTSELFADINVRNNHNTQITDLDFVEKVIRKHFHFCIKNVDSLYARKGLISRFGGVITHFGILLITLGVLYSIVGVWFHFSSGQSQIIIAEGDEKDKYIDWSKNAKAYQDTPESIIWNKLGFKIRLIDFDVEKFPGTEMPKSYTSIVEFIDGEKTTRKAINMTQTASYKDYKFNQTHYFALNSSMSRRETDFLYQIDGDKFLKFYNQKRLLMSFISKDGIEKKFDVLIGQKDMIPGTQYIIVVDENFISHIFESEEGLQGISEIKEEREIFTKDFSDSFKIMVDNFFSNFSIENGKAKNIDNTFNNPAIKYTVLINDKELYSDYAFNKKELRDFSTKDGIFNVEFVSYLFDGKELGTDDSRQSQVLSNVQVILNLQNCLNGEKLNGLKSKVGVVKVFRPVVIKTHLKMLTTENSCREQSRLFPTNKNKLILFKNNQSGSNINRQSPSFDLRIIGFEDTYYSVLGVSKSGLFQTLYWYLSFCLVMIGPFLAFFIKYRELWVYYDKLNKKIYIAEESSRDAIHCVSTRKLFNKIVKEISAE